MEVLQNFKRYFWEFDFLTITKPEFRPFFIERILSRCDFEDLFLIKQNFQREFILNVLNSSINIKPQRKDFIKKLIS